MYQKLLIWKAALPLLLKSASFLVNMTQFVTRIVEGNDEYMLDLMVDHCGSVDSRFNII